MSLDLLGELRLHVNDVEVPPLSPKARALVASLALPRGEVVSVARLNEELWPELSPDRAKRVVQVRVAEIRKLLTVTSTPCLLESVASGYRLTIDDDAVDTNRFTALLDDAQRCSEVGDSLGTVTNPRAALGLWRGLRSLTRNRASTWRPRPPGSTNSDSARSKTAWKQSWPLAVIIGWSPS